jgi:hypothetical protein
MRSILVNFSSTYHRLVAREAIRKGATITHIFCIPCYHDPKGSILDSENSLRDNYRQDPEFSNTKIIDLRELQYADFIIREYASTKSCLSESFLRELSECEAVFMRHSDRFSFYPTSAALRRRTYHSLLCYMLDMIKEARPDVLIFADSPHVGFDTVLYYVAKALNVRTLIVEETHLDNSSLLIEDYRRFPLVPAEFLAEDPYAQLLTVLEGTRFADLFNSGKGTRSLRTIWLKHEKMLDSERDVTVRRERLIVSIKKIIKVVLKKVLGIDIEKTVYSRALVFNSMRASSDLRRAYSKYEVEKERLKKDYRERADSAPNLGVPYVFFPLHLQPEKTTSAFGGVFEDQYLAIKILSTSIPDEVVIYVKEHPAQLVSDRIENMLYRDECYYDLIAGIQKVRYVGLDASYDALMSGSLFNATITGSVGWESMIRGKPIMIFGNSWYAGCDACFRVGSTDECSNAIGRMLSMTQDDVRKALIRYVLYYERFFIPFASNPRHVAEFDLSYEEQIAEYSRLILAAPLDVNSTSRHG